MGVCHGDRPTLFCKQGWSLVLGDMQIFKLRINQDEVAIKMGGDKDTPRAPNV